MKFIINTSVDPHFCALFDEQSNLVDKIEWTTRKADGGNIFNFLQKNDISNMSLSLIGGISGPGGFSSLRVTAGILNSISLTKNIPIHQVRADTWISAILEMNNYPPNAFLLNSFSDGVFYRNCSHKELNRTTIKEASQQFKNTDLFIEALPLEKKDQIKKSIKLSLKNSEKILLNVLETIPPQKIFIPDYEFPPV